MGTSEPIIEHKFSVLPNSTQRVFEKNFASSTRGKDARCRLITAISHRRYGPEFPSVRTHLRKNPLWGNWNPMNRRRSRSRPSSRTPKLWRWAGNPNEWKKKKTKKRRSLKTRRVVLTSAADSTLNFSFLVTLVRGFARTIIIIYQTETIVH